MSHWMASQVSNLLRLRSPFDGRDALLLLSAASLFYGLSLWSLALAFSTLGGIGLAAWSLPWLTLPRKGA